MGIEEMYPSAFGTFLGDFVHRDFKKRCVDGIVPLGLVARRVQEDERSTRRHSCFYIGLHGREWLKSLDLFKVESVVLAKAVLLMSLSPPYPTGTTGD